MTTEINHYEQPELIEQTAEEEATNSLAKTLDQVQQRMTETKLREQLIIHAKQVTEALLFATTEPLTLDKIRQILTPILELKPRAIKELIYELREEYLVQKRSFELIETKEGYLLQSREEFSRYIGELYRDRRGEKLSQASSEVLAIIAFRQPITRPEIDAIRGVDSSGTLHNLLERNLIESCGQAKGPGRPTLYQVTVGFLQHYGLNNIEQLKKE